MSAWQHLSQLNFFSPWMTWPFPTGHLPEEWWEAVCRLKALQQLRVVKSGKEFSKVVKNTMWGHHCLLLRAKPKGQIWFHISQWHSLLIMVHCLQNFLPLLMLLTCLLPPSYPQTSTWHLADLHHLFLRVCTTAVANSCRIHEEAVMCLQTGEESRYISFLICCCYSWSAPVHELIFFAVLPINKQLLVHCHATEQTKSKVNSLSMLRWFVT